MTCRVILVAAHQRSINGRLAVLDELELFAIRTHLIEIDPRDGEAFQRRAAFSISLACQRSVNLAARPDDHALTAESERHIFANAVRADHIDSVLVSARTHIRLPLV